MATTFLSTLPSSSPSTSSCSSSSSTLGFISPQKNNAKRLVVSCKASSFSPNVTKRSLSICVVARLVLSFSSNSSRAAILEADDDEELLEKVKRDRKKRIERQSVINSSNKEKGYLQDVVYKLSKIGQAIENNDLSTANSVLGGSTNTDWVQKANLAFSKLTDSSEEKNEVDTFNSSLASLISSVGINDIESSKTAFVSSATAFEKWTTLTGLVAQLKGL